MSHRCPDCGYGCRNFNEQHTHDCKPFTIKDIDLSEGCEKYIKNACMQIAEKYNKEWDAAFMDAMVYGTGKVHIDKDLNVKHLPVVRRTMNWLKRLLCKHGWHKLTPLAENERNFNMAGCERCGIITKIDVTKPCSYSTDERIFHTGPKPE